MYICIYVLATTVPFVSASACLVFSGSYRNWAPPAHSQAEGPRLRGLSAVARIDRTIGAFRGLSMVVLAPDRP